jgi:hypothetical protein
MRYRLGGYHLIAVAFLALAVLRFLYGNGVMR